MRVLHFYKTAFPDTIGGVEQVIHQIAAGAQPLGVQTDVLTLAPCPHPALEEVQGYRVHRAPLDFEIASTRFSAAALPLFRQLAQEADLIHFHYPWPFMDMVHFAARIRRPTVLTYHSDIIRQQLLLKLYQPLKKRFLAGMDRIVATSPNYLASSRVLQNHADKVEVIPIGLDKALYPTPSAQRLADWRARLGPRFFLFVGVLRYYKGLHILLEAAGGTDYPIVIVGSGPIEAELKVAAQRRGLHNIHFIGHLPEEDKVALLQLCHAIVFPSHLRSEAFGISLLEGAMYGKPMISSEIGTGTTYINIGDETGLVIPPSDPAALRQAMEWLWNHPEQAAAMGQRAEARYWQHFTAAQMAQAYVALYQRLIAGH
ncbi:MAG: glycosyltransferase family 4 protein [Castellaniella sp.]|nr:glycosyltransferase family 4 protein [Castellaniella sp.]